MTIRNIHEQDVPAIRKLVGLCKPLGHHTAFTYWVVAKYFSNHSFVLEGDSKMIGFITTIRSTAIPDVAYIWQIGVLKGYRGQGLSKKLIGAVARSIGKGKRIQFSIDEENEASYHAFKSYASANGLLMEAVGELAFTDPFSKASEDEVIYEFRAGEIFTG